MDLWCGVVLTCLLLQEKISDLEAKIKGLHAHEPSMLLSLAARILAASIFLEVKYVTKFIC